MEKMAENYEEKIAKMGKQSDSDLKCTITSEKEKVANNEFTEFVTVGIEQMAGGMGQRLIITSATTIPNLLRATVTLQNRMSSILDPKSKEFKLSPTDLLECMMIVAENRDSFNPFSSNKKNMFGL